MTRHARIGAFIDCMSVASMNSDDVMTCTLFIAMGDMRCLKIHKYHDIGTAMLKTGHKKAVD